MQALSTQQAKELYQQIGKIDLNSKAAEEAFSSVQTAGRKVTPKQFAIFTKIGKACNEKEFIDFVTKGEYPAIKLTNDEMEALKGGLDPISGAILIGMGCYLLGKAILRC